MIKLKTATLLLVFACTFFCVCDSSAKTGKNYYVDALQGNDDANGLSKQTAWKSLERLKDIQLRAGDSLLFRRGSVFIGILELSAKGKADKRVIIDAYGIGRKPCIKAPDASLYTILVQNSDYLTLQNLEVVNTGTERLLSLIHI